MKKALVWVIICLGVAAYIKFALLSHADECTALQETAIQLIETNASCNVAEDCTVERFNCPFECLTVINQQARDSVVSAVNTYNKSCMMICPDCPKSPPRKAQCINNRCSVS